MAYAISEDCYRIVGPYCDAQLLGLQVLKGVPEQSKTYSLRDSNLQSQVSNFTAPNLRHFAAVSMNSRDFGILFRIPIPLMSE